MIMRVGATNVERQTLVNLRELILGEPGTFVTLGFSRGGMQSQFFEVRPFQDRCMPLPWLLDCW